MRSTRVVLSALAVTTLLATAACSAGGQSSAGSAATGPVAKDSAGGTSAPAAPPTTASGGKADAGLTAAVIQRSIIRTASLTVRTNAVATNVTKAEDATTQLGGLVGDANITTDPDEPARTTASLELRVPGPAYGALMTALSKLGQVVHKTEQASDVTSQVIDVNSRLATQRQSLEQVRALLTRAGSLSQILLVEQDLTRREAELESLEAQRKVLADQTALATIDLTLVTPKAAPKPPPPARHAGFTTGLLAGWHGLTATAIVAATAVGAALPFAVPVLLLGGLILLLWRRRPRSPAVADAD
jgi:Domain of unknown function (DUF4349)